MEEFFPLIEKKAVLAGKAEAIPTPIPPPTMSRPVLQPYANSGVTFVEGTPPDIRVRLRNLVETTASIIHTDLGACPSQPASCSLLDDLEDEEEQVVMTMNEIRPLVEQLHAEARAQLMDAYLNASEQLRIDRIFRSLGDVLSALRGAETASVALRLLRQQVHPIAAAVNFEGEQIVHAIARQTDQLTMKTAEALSHAGNPNGAIDAATAIRGVRTLFEQGERIFRQKAESRTSREMLFGPVEYRRRVCRAALWSLILCAESMARVAARFAMTAEEQAHLSSTKHPNGYPQKGSLLPASRSPR